MFGFPLAFLWLAAVGPVLVVLYLFRQQTKSYIVPSILHFLPMPDARIPVRRRLTRFVTDPFFYLQLLLLLLLITALARPVREKEIRHRVFIVDVTASMQAKEGEKTRLALAVERATQLLKTYGEEDRTAVLAAWRRVETVMPFTSSREELVRGLRSARPAEGGGSCAEAIYVASNLLLSAGGGDIVLFTDSPLALPEGLDKEGLSIRIEGIGAARQNLGIVSATAPTSLLAGRGQVVGQVRNFGRDVAEGELALHVGEEFCGRVKISVPAMRVETYSFDVRGKSGLARLDLHFDDALDLDNQVHVLLPEEKQLSLQIYSDSAVIYDFLNKLGVFRLALEPPDRPASGLATTADVTLFDGFAPREQPPGDALFLDPPASGPLFRHLGRASGEVYYWEKGHSLVDQVALDNLRFESFARLELVPTAKVVVGARESPLLATIEQDERRSVICALPLRQMLNEPSAVLLLFKMVEWCSPVSRGRETEFPAGKPLACALPARLPEVTVSTPCGESRVVRPSGDRLIFDDTRRIGPYRVAGPGFERIFIVKLGSPAESDLTQVMESKELAATREGDATGKIRSSYTPLILLGLPFLFAIEWLAFFWRRRRKEN